MNIKDYSKTKIESKKTPKIDEKSLKKTNEDYGDLVQEFMKRYGKMSEKQMMDEMFLLIEKKKREGSFNLEQIKDIAKSVRPFLSFEQQKYMEELLEKIK